MLRIKRLVFGSMLLVLLLTVVPTAAQVRPVSDSPVSSDSVALRQDSVRHLPLLSLRSNLLYDLFYMPNFGFAPMWNIALEYLPRRGHFTVGASFLSPFYQRWKKQKFFQIRNYELEGRFYFRRATEADYQGLYVGLAADVNKYIIGLGKDKGWQGEGWGAQATVGYVMPISRDHFWKLHFNIGLGYYQTHYDPYVYGVPEFFGREDDGHYYYDTNLLPEQFKKRQHLYRWLGPTQVGISLSYDLRWRKDKLDNR